MFIRNPLMAHIRILLIIFIIILNYNNSWSWEVYDKVIAIVNETPIIESEVIQKFEKTSIP